MAVCCASAVRLAAYVGLCTCSWQQSDALLVYWDRAAAEAAKADPIPILRALAAQLLQGSAAESPPESLPPATAATAFLGCKATVVRLPPPTAESCGAAAGSSSGGTAIGAPQQPAVDIPSAAADDALAACTARRLAMQVSIRGHPKRHSKNRTANAHICGASCAMGFMLRAAEPICRPAHTNLPARVLLHSRLACK